MFRCLFLFILTITFSLDTYAQSKSSTKELINNVYTDFTKGSYEDVIKTLDKLNKRLKPNSKKYKEIQGLIHYWRGMSYSRMSEYELAEKNFRKAVKLKYKAKDIYYEFGQVLYVSNKYKKARVAFKRSFKQNYKKGVSLYYIAFISQELRDDKKAVSFYSMIEKLSDEDKKDVIQAARMQIGDIYLKKIEKLPESFKDVEKYVIPQYEKALEFDEETPLADQIKQKIEDLQRRYELVLFKMRNGRPTSRPPYYLRANVLYGVDDNVTTISEDSKSTSNEEDYASNYYSAGIFGRYTFYPNSTISYAPEVNFNTTRYLSDSSTIYALDNYSLTTSLKINYEHIYKENPATFYIDISYAYGADGSEAAADEEQSLAYVDSTLSLTFSEEFQYWTNKATTLRFKYSKTEAEETADNFTNNVFSYEQIIPMDRTTFFFTSSYDLKRYEETTNEALNTDTLNLRLDVIFPTFLGLFNPTVYGSYTNTSYFENTDRGAPTLLTYGVNLNRPIGKKWYFTFDYSMASQTADKDEDDTYIKQLMTFNIDYIY